MTVRVVAMAVAVFVYWSSNTTMPATQIPQPVLTQRWRLVRIVDREAIGFRPLGTGFLLMRGPFAFVVTNAHVVRKAKGRPWVSIGKQAHESQEQVTDDNHDVAVLRLGKDVDISGETTERSSSAGPGDQVYAFGFPDDLGTATDPLISAGHVLWAGEYSPTEQMAITSGHYPGVTVPAFIVTGIACKHGASGGPVFGSTGAILGYVKGTLDTGECICVSIERALQLIGSM